MKEERVCHPFSPVYDENSTILILGTFPSVKSREVAFYYGNPQNRFWPVVAHLTQEPLPETIGEKLSFLLRKGIALWDVLSSCDIQGSSDSSIRNPVVNDLTVILREAPIKKIFTNGKKAQQLYEKYMEPRTGVNSHCLPSTSPANGHFHMEDLLAEWKIIIEYLSPSP